MKQSKISRSRKRSLNDPDEFIALSAKMIRFFAENKTVLGGILGAILVGTVAFAGVGFMSSRAEKQASGMLEKAVEKYMTAKKNTGAADALKTVDADFQRILDKYSGRQGGKQARLVYADFCFEAGAFDRSIALYKGFLENADKQPSLRNLVLNGLGYAHEAKKEYAAAAGYFEMIAAGDSPVMKADALLNLGRLYDRIGDADKSKAMYGRLAAEYPDSLYVELAREKVAG